MHMKNSEKYHVRYDGDENQRIDEIADYIINAHPDVEIEVFVMHLAVIWRKINDRI